MKLIPLIESIKREIVSFFQQNQFALFVVIMIVVTLVSIYLKLVFNHEEAMRETVQMCEVAYSLHGVDPQNATWICGDWVYKR